MSQALKQHGEHLEWSSAAQAAADEFHNILIKAKLKLNKYAERGLSRYFKVAGEEVCNADLLVSFKVKS